MHLRVAQVASGAMSDMHGAQVGAIVESGSLLSTRKTMSEGGSLPTLLEQKRIQNGASHKLVGAAKKNMHADPYICAYVLAQLPASSFQLPASSLLDQLC